MNGVGDMSGMDDEIGMSDEGEESAESDKGGGARMPLIARADRTRDRARRSAG